MYKKYNMHEDLNYIFSLQKYQKYKPVPETLKDKH